MTQDPWGSGTAPHRDKMERASTEIIRRVKLESRNDPTFVPTPDDLSQILAARHFVSQVVIAPPGPDDAVGVLANRIFQHGAFAATSGFDATQGNVSDLQAILAARVFLHVAPPIAGGYAIATDLNQSNTIVARDLNGGFSAGPLSVVRVNLSGTSATFVTGSFYLHATLGATMTGFAGSAGDWTVVAPSGSTALQVPTGTLNLVVGGSCKVTTGFGCNGQPTRTAAALGATLNAYAAGANGLSSGADMAALVAQVQAITAALKANGIGV